MDFQISVRHLVEFIFRHGDIDNLKRAVPEEAMQEGARIHRMLQKKYEATLNYESEVALKYCHNTGRYNIFVEGRADGILHEDEIIDIQDIDNEKFEDSRVNNENQHLNELPAALEEVYNNKDQASTILGNRIEQVKNDIEPVNVEITNVIDKERAAIPENTLSLKKLNQDITNKIANFQVSDVKKAADAQVYSHVVIDEIKGTYKKIDYINEPEIEHLAQAKCYAYIYAKENGLQEIGVRITYCGIESGDIKFFNAVYTYEEIENWFLSLMIEYSRWTDYEYDWAMVRKFSIDRLEFPFEYREGQKKLVSAVYRTIEARKKLFIQAPTGSGKTIATVFPAIKSIGEEKAEKLFYLTAKTITRTVAEDTFNLLRDNGLAFKSVTLTAKEKICPYNQCECNPRACAYAKGHLDRINEALYDVISNEQEFSREIIVSYAEKHQVCAFELSLDISLFADGIICDYNYVFDPHVYLRRYFGEGNQGRYIFLVDEAHNLLDRSREMYSADLCREEMLELRNVIGSTDPKLATSLVTCARQMNKLKKTCDTFRLIDDYTEVSKALGRVVTKIEAYLEHSEFDNSSFDFSESGENNKKTSVRNQIKKKNIDRNKEDIEGNDARELTYEVKDNVRRRILDFYFKAMHFQYVEGIRNENYRCYCEKREDDTFIIKQLCIDPSDNLRDVMLRAESVALFSATLLPIQYYKSLLGGQNDDYEIYADSVFDSQKRLLFIANDVSSKYSRRTDAEYRRMAEYIKHIVSLRPGNYLVFCPSFAVQKQVVSLYERDYIDALTEKVIVQTEHMSEEEREDFLETFNSNRWCGDIHNDGLDSDNDAVKFDKELTLSYNNEINRNLNDDCRYFENKNDLIQVENFIFDVEDDFSENEKNFFDEKTDSQKNKNDIFEIENVLCKNKIVIGFCVLGGIFSEGIDLKGDSLIGSVIIGNGLPGISIERNIMKDFFEERGFNGFDYAYKIPGLNKVEQAAGRVIRTSEDIGVIALLEERFLEGHYGIMFPKEWSDRKITSIYNVRTLIENFWGKTNKN